MREKFVYPENMLTKNQIANLIIDGGWDERSTDKGDLEGYASMHFGENNIDNGLHRYSEEEVREWYYREYLPDRETDIENGYDRGQ